MSSKAVEQKRRNLLLSAECEPCDDYSCCPCCVYIYILFFVSQLAYYTWFNSAQNTYWLIGSVCALDIHGGAKKRGHPKSLQIFWKLHDRIAWKLVNFCNIICWNRRNFLFKNFIALWRHLAKTQLLCDAQIYLYSVNKWLCSAYNIAEVHQFLHNSVVEFSEYLQWDRMAPFLRLPVSIFSVKMNVVINIQ